MKFEKFDKYVKDQMPKRDDQVDFVSDEHYDQLWNNVYPEIKSFYEKKKKRRFVFFLLPLILIIVVLPFYFLQHESDQADINILESNSTSQSPYQKNIADSDLHESKNNLVDPAEKPTISKEASLSRDLKSPSRRSIVREGPSRAIQNQEIQMTSGSTAFDKNQLISIKNGDFGLPHAPNVHNDIQKASGPTIEQDQDQSQVRSTLLRVSLLEILSLDSEEIQLDISTKGNYNTQIFESYVQPKRYRSIGIGHSRFVDNPFHEPIQINEDNAVFNFTSINLLYSRRYNKRFAFTSGFHYLRQKVQVPFVFEDLLYDSHDDPIQNSLVMLQTDGPSASKEVLQNTIGNDQFQIKFLPEAMVQDGDLLDAIGSATVKLDIYQIPFQVDYHMGRGRWEFVGFTGLSLNFFHLQLSELPVEVFKNGILVSNETNFKPISKYLLLPNIIFGSGIRYQLTDRLDVQALLNLNPLDLRYARMQFGILRKW